MPIAAEVVLDAFADTVVPNGILIPGHTHPTAASLRNVARDVADLIATRCGLDLYSLQMSKSDQRKGFRGSRQWYWAKDTKVCNRKDVLRNDDIAWICDVDYYLDMVDLLNKEPRPYLLYTVVPEQACSSGQDDSSFCFDNDGALVTYVSGGGQYRHHLWNYGFDSIKAVRRFCGIPIQLTTYSIERKQIGSHRQLIMLTPLSSFRGVWACVANWLLTDSHELTRFNPITVAGDGSRFVRFNVATGNSMKITTARPNTFLCATVEARDDAAIGTAARLGTTNLMLPTTTSWIGKEERHAAAILTEYYRSVVKVDDPMVFPVSQAVRAYQYQPDEFNPDEKPKLQAFMSPLVHGAFAPVANEAGEKQCVEGRINSLKKDEPKPHSFRDRCIHEFAEFVVDGCVLTPVCFETVADKQTGAAQKLSLLKAVVAGPWFSTILKCFIKSEAYPDVKDPRNISTFDDSLKLDMSMFCLSLAEHCKKFSWYGPGKDPLMIANRMAEIGLNAHDFLNISDYHRMDGTISQTLREVDRAVFMKAFKNHRTELNELLKRCFNNVGYLPKGTKFDQGTSQGSGNPDTSTVQTLRSAFTAYLGFRNVVTPQGRRYSPEEAFSSLGIHLGDDGVDPDLPIRNHEWASKRVGLVLEASVVQRGERGVNFLARYYSQEIWYGRNDSMCDIKRQLSKFHTTVRLPSGVKPETKLVEKSLSFLATDRNTPVLGSLCQQVLMHEPEKRVPSLGIGSWWSKFEQSRQFPNNNDDGWMDVEFEHMLPEFDRSLFNQWLAKTQSLTEILEAPICTPITAPTPTVVDVVVDGCILDAAPSKAPSSTVESSDEATSEAAESKRAQSQQSKKKARPRARKTPKHHRVTIK
jgi:hypothetical protein